jgi:hypothetical protein
MKHDIGEFIGCHKQVKRNKPTGTSATDIIRLAKIMYQIKHSKGCEFMFEHCWILVRDFLRWADGWGSMKQVTPSKRRAPPSSHDCPDSAPESQSAVEGNGEDRNLVLRERPSRTKAAKAAHKEDKIRERVAYKQAEATVVLAEATVAKNVLLAEQNLLMLMTIPDSQISGGAAMFEAVGGGGKYGSNHGGHTDGSRIRRRFNFAPSNLQFQVDSEVGVDTGTLGLVGNRGSTGMYGEAPVSAMYASDLGGDWGNIARTGDRADSEDRVDGVNVSLALNGRTMY